jgi:peptidyl-tRNA hydrolase
MKLYIAVLDEFPDYMVPTLVAHAVLGAHLKFESDSIYNEWITNHFKKCVLRVNQKEFKKICELENVYLGFEKKTLDGKISCAVIRPIPEEEPVPDVLKFAKLWKPVSASCS